MGRSALLQTPKGMTGWPRSVVQARVSVLKGLWQRKQSCFWGPCFLGWLQGDLNLNVRIALLAVF